MYIQVIYSKGDTNYTGAATGAKIGNDRGAETGAAIGNDLGAKIGSETGPDRGAAIGNKTGLVVGAFVCGAMVGGTGAALGLLVGAKLGFVVGAKLGLVVGLVGAAVGFDGAVVFTGAALGLLVGRKEGLEEGEREGLVVGERDGVAALTRNKTCRRASNNRKNLDIISMIEYWYQGYNLFIGMIASAN